MILRCKKKEKRRKKERTNKKKQGEKKTPNLESYIKNFNLRFIGNFCYAI